MDDESTERYNSAMKDEVYYAVKFQLWIAKAMRDKLHTVAKTQNMKAAELVRRLILNYFDQLDGVRNDDIAEGSRRPDKSP